MSGFGRLKLLVKHSFIFESFQKARAREAKRSFVFALKHFEGALGAHG